MNSHFLHIFIEPQEANVGCDPIKFGLDPILWWNCETFKVKMLKFAKRIHIDWEWKQYMRNQSWWEGTWQVDPGRSISSSLSLYCKGIYRRSPLRFADPIPTSIQPRFEKQTWLGFYFGSLHIEPILYFLLPCSSFPSCSHISEFPTVSVSFCCISLFSCLRIWHSRWEFSFAIWNWNMKEKRFCSWNYQQNYYAIQVLL